MLELAIIAGVGIAVCFGAKALMADASAPAAAGLDNPAAGPPRETPPGVVPPPVVTPPGAVTRIRVIDMPRSGLVFVDNARAAGPSSWEDAGQTRWLVQLNPGPREIVVQAPSGERRAASVTAVGGLTTDITWGAMRVLTPAPAAPPATPAAPPAAQGGGFSVPLFLGGLFNPATVPVAMTVRYDPGAYFRAVADGRGGQTTLPYPRPLRIERGPNATSIESATAFQVGDPGFSTGADRLAQDAFDALNAPGKYAYRAARTQSALLTGDGGSVAATILREPSGSKATFTVASPGNRVTLKNACANAFENDIGVMVYKAKPNELVITAPPPDGLDVTDPTFYWTMIAANETKTFTLVPPRAPVTANPADNASGIIFLGR